MTWPFGLAIYFVLWWITLLAVLPWGVRSQHESGDVVTGSDPGAPTVHLGWKKLLWTTIAAGVVFSIGYALYRFDLLPLDFLMRISNPPHS